jgi:hypothetical protein
VRDRRAGCGTSGEWRAGGRGLGNTTPPAARVLSARSTSIFSVQVVALPCSEGCAPPSPGLDRSMSEGACAVLRGNRWSSCTARSSGSVSRCVQLGPLVARTSRRRWRRHGAWRARLDRVKARFAGPRFWVGALSSGTRVLLGSACRRCFRGRRFIPDMTALLSSPAPRSLFALALCWILRLLCSAGAKTLPGGAHPLEALRSHMRAQPSCIPRLTRYLYDNAANELAATALSSCLRLIPSTRAMHRCSEIQVRAPKSPAAQLFSRRHSRLVWSGLCC